MATKTVSFTDVPAEAAASPAETAPSEAVVPAQSSAPALYEGAQEDGHDSGDINLPKLALLQGTHDKKLLAAFGAAGAPTEGRGHHPDSPSSLQNSAACPHFVNRQSDSEASKLGTLQHKASETRDLSILEEPEHIDAVKRTIKMEDEWENRLRKAGADKVEVIREEYLAVCPEETRDEWRGITGGYPDTLLLAHFGTYLLAVILDWKFGKMLVTPTKDNLQGMAYALAVFQRWLHVQEITVCFYHPHVELDAPLPEYTHVFKRADMPALELAIRHTIAVKRRAQAEGWNSDIRPQPATNLCLWCAQLANCPAVTQLAAVASSKYQRLEVPVEVRPAYLADASSLKQLHQLTGVLEAFAKAARARIRDMVLTEGIEVPGLKPVTKADREVVDVDVVKETAERHGVPPEAFYKCLRLPITALEDVIKKAAPKGKGAASVRAFQADLEECGAVRKGTPYTYLVETKESEIIDI